MPLSIASLNGVFGRSPNADKPKTAPNHDRETNSSATVATSNCASSNSTSDASGRPNCDAGC